MSLAQADAVLRESLEALPFQHTALAKGGYVTRDPNGRQVVFQARQAAALEDWVISVQISILADVEDDAVFAVGHVLARLNAHTGPAKFYYNADFKQLLVGSEILAELAHPQWVAAATGICSALADTQGDQLAEHFGGRSVFWAHGRE